MRQSSTWERGKIGRRRRIHTGKTKTITIIDTRIRIDNLQNYCLGTRYGARSWSRLRRSCQLRSFAIDMVLKSLLSTVSSRFGDVLTLTIYLQIFCEFKTHFWGGGGEANLFDRKRRCMARNGDVVDGVACLVVVRSFIAYLNLQTSDFVDEKFGT